MNLIRYFSFYYKLTRKRLLWFIGVTMLAISLQMLSAMSIMAVLSFGGKNELLNKFSPYTSSNIFGFASQESQLLFLTLLALIAFHASAGMMIFATWYTAKLHTDMFVETQERMIRKLLDVDYEFFMTKNVGYLSNVIVQQIRQMSQSFKFYTNIITNGLFGCTYGLLPFCINPKLTSCAILFGFPLIFLLPAVNRWTKEYSVKSVRQISDLNGIVIQLVSYFKYLKSTLTWPPVIRKQKGYSLELARLVKKLALLGGINEHGLLAYVVTCFLILVYWQISVNKVPIVELMFVLGFLYRSSTKMITVPSSYQKFLGVSGSILACMELESELDKHLERLDQDHGADPDFSGPINFDDVCFQFSGANVPVLNHVSLDIQPNTSVAFVGDTGSGKSTIVNMITGLLRPTSGSLTLAGTDFGALSAKRLRGGIGYVTQEPVIFNDTVENNIKMWNSDINSEAMKNATRQALADGFIEEMPNAYQTLLGDHGANVSGGQRQRINLSREFLRETPVLILDEATSALDSETERLIQQNIDAHRGKRTIILIAHRLSTIRNCDQIFVLDKGEIAESGSYQELYDKNGKFRRMVDTQNLG